MYFYLSTKLQYFLHHCIQKYTNTETERQDKARRFTDKHTQTYKHIIIQVHTVTQRQTNNQIFMHYTNSSALKHICTYTEKHSQTHKHREEQTD